MKKFRGVAQALASLVAVAALILILVLAFRAVSGGSGAAPAATGYPAPGATPVGSPYPTSILGVTPTPALPPLNDAPDQFDPKTYRLPDMIAGYTVLGVQTPSNTACIFSGRKTLVLQSNDPTVQDALKNDRTMDVTNAMAALGFKTTEWDISIGGPNSTRTQLIADVQQWNRERQKWGCVTTGGPAVTAAAKPTQ